jgi:hypothetical protein
MTAAEFATYKAEEIFKLQKRLDRILAGRKSATMRKEF